MLMVDGRSVLLQPGDEQRSLLEVLRLRAGATSVKDGCAPQGQCGCCTVLVDGAPRVACVTATRRVVGRSITTVEGLPAATRAAWADALTATGGSQCGFCTPGIIVRLAALADPARIEDALLAHLCRCTGWRTILDAASMVAAATQEPGAETLPGRGAARFAPPRRDLDLASMRATLEGGTPQRVGPDVTLGRGGFAADSAPAGHLVAVPDGAGGWAVGETTSEARAAAGKVRGRRSTLPLRWPLESPPGTWDLTLATTWVEPAYLEPDCSWCEPGGEPVGPLANGGAFGGKVSSPTAAAADALRRVAPGWRVEEVELPGPPTSAALRAAGWAEAAAVVAVLAAGPDGRIEVTTPPGAWAAATLTPAGIDIELACGPPLDEVVLRSWCAGAAHQALGWVRSEGVAVDATGEVQDLTIRSFGILRARDTPTVNLSIHTDRGPDEPVPGSDAVFAAVAAATWRAEGLPERWPCLRR